MVTYRMSPKSLKHTPTAATFSYVDLLQIRATYPDPCRRFFFNAVLLKVYTQYPHYPRHPCRWYPFRTPPPSSNYGCIRVSLPGLASARDVHRRRIDSVFFSHSTHNIY